MEKDKYLTYKFEKFANTDEVGGIIAARKRLDELKEFHKPFLEKHPEYEEDYSFNVKELDTELEYFIYNKDLYGSKEDRGNIQKTGE